MFLKSNLMKKVLFAAAMMLAMGTTVATSAAEKVSLNGQISVETDYQTIDIKDLPQAVQDAVAAKYPEQMIKEAAVEEVAVYGPMPRRTKPSVCIFRIARV